VSKSAARLALFVICWAPLISVSGGITRTWTGAVSTAFSAPNNWSPSGVPASDDALVFPAATLNNDLPVGTAFGPMTFNGNATLNGNSMTLTGNLTFGAAVLFTCNADLKVSAALSFGGAVTASQNYGSIDVNGQALAIASPVTVKSLNGSGAITVSGPITLTHDGTFNGTITAPNVNIYASLPNANVAHVNGSSYWATVVGEGTLGSVDTSSISPALHGTAGTLKTRSLYINMIDPPSGAFADFDLDAGGPSDQIQVTGTVTLGNPTLEVTLVSGTPTAGQTFKLIDNDGTDAVSGTFGNLPEGATLIINGYIFTISYHGGDGNDVVLTAATPVKTWNGSVNALWSNPGNWTPNAIPVSGEPLMFPDGAVMMNDLPPGTVVGPLHFGRHATLSGNPLTLMGDVVVEPFGVFTCNAPLKIGVPLSLGERGTDSHYGSVDVNGQTLTFETVATVQSLNGTGTVIAYTTLGVSQDGTFNGTIVGDVDIGGSMPNANVAPANGSVYWPRLVGDGTLGNVEVSSISPGAGFLYNTNTGILRTKSLYINNTDPAIGGWAAFNLNAGGISDQIQATGKVTLGKPTINVNVSGTPVFGRRFRIIDNQGPDPVSGTFLGMSEGAFLSGPTYLFRLTYAGGDGNDVELISAAESSATMSQATDASMIGEPVTFQAVLSSSHGAPSGTVTFVDDFVTVASVPLVNGTATFNTSTLAVGSHIVWANYAGDGPFFGSQSFPVQHWVNPGQSSTTIQAVHIPAVFGAAEFRVLTVPVAPAAGTVTGAFELREGNKVLGRGNVGAGGGHVFLPELTVGTHTLIASYHASANFGPSDSAPFTVEVTEAPTQIQATKDAGASTEGTVVLNIIVTPLTSASASPTGSITISENGVVRSQEPVTGSLKVTLNLPAGHHALAISYSGDSNFLGSAVALDLDGAASRHRAVRP
jgi:hypothetical protein